MKQIIRSLSLTKLVFAFIATTMVVNVATWWIYGRETILIKTSVINQEACPLGSVDTLYVHGGFERDSEWPLRSPIGGFKQSSRDKLIIKLSEHHVFANKVVYVDEIASGIGTQRDSVRLGALVNRRFPLHAETWSWIDVPGGISLWEQKWIWLFGWHRLGGGNVQCT